MKRPLNLIFRRFKPYGEDSKPEGGEMENMKKGQMGLAGVFIGIMVVLIMGVIVLSIIFTQISNQTTTTAVSNDLFTADTASCVRVTNNCMLSTGTLTVTSGGDTIPTANYSRCPSGEDNYGIQASTADLDAVALNATYTEVDCGYIEAGTSRTVITLLPLLFAVGLLVFVVGYMASKR